MAAEAQMVRRAQTLLKAWLPDEAEIERPSGGRAPVGDIVVHQGRSKLVVEVKRLADAGWLGGAVAQARAAARRLGKGALPVVAVPFMGEVGRRLCEEANVSWFDLSGNAHIVAPGLRIHVEGKPNLFKRPGRPSTVFSPKSSRIVRQLLLDPQRAFQQRELAREAGLDEGFASRIVKKLVADEMVRRDTDGSLRVVSPSLLLDSWRESYVFSKHQVIPGHMAVRSGDEAVVRIGDALRKKKLEHAATGLAAAWLMTKFATFRLATFFVTDEPPETVFKEVGFRREERGANVWFVVPNDEGVFAGAEVRESVRCVHPVQAYLDLKAQPERSAEAAEELRKRLLKWKV